MYGESQLDVIINAMTILVVCITFLKIGVLHQKLWTYLVGGLFIVGSVLDIFTPVTDAIPSIIKTVGIVLGLIQFFFILRHRRQIKEKG